MTYDPTPPAKTYSYDQENRIIGTAGYTYTYDADGNRVEKSNGSTGTIYWYMSPGIVAESDLSGNLKSEYVFFDGERVARKDFPGNSVFYYFSDHLKTASVITDSAGTIKEDEDYYPWGGELQFVNNDSNHYKFGGHERDNETGLDYMLARYYFNPLGRFLTPDWAGHPTEVPYANFGNPQSLNLYRYAQNNPKTFGDPDGHCDSTLLCGISFGIWLGSSVGADGGWKPFAKNAGIGLLKGTGNFVVDTLKMGAAGGQAATGNGVGAAFIMLQPNPNALQPSNQTQADVSKATEVGLGVATAVIPGLGAESTEATLTRLAGEAVDTVGPGSGAVYGTRVHTAFEQGVKALDNPNLNTEVSFLNGSRVPRGTPGSIRVDVAAGPRNAPTAVYDLKTGNAQLTPARIQQIQQHVPQLPNGNPVPVTEIRPPQ